MSSMIHYHQIKQEANPNILNFVMPQTKAHIFVFDAYCTNPTCHCEEVVLEFAQLIEEEWKQLFSIRFSLKTWQEIDDPALRRYISSFEMKAICNQFMSGLESVKQLLWDHYQEAKSYGQKQMVFADHIQQAIQQGKVVRYHDIAGDDTDEVFHRQQGQVYYLEDSYCTDRSCRCHEVHLTCYPLNTKQEQQHALCTAIIDLDQPDRFKIHSGQVSASFLSTFLAALWSNQPELLITYRNRAKMMKQLQAQTNAQPSVIGRNDPCPCGSKKKYKKCCGMK